MLPTCRDMTRLLSDAMDRTLPFHVRMRMRLHLRICVACERYKHQLTLIRNLLRKDGAQLIDHYRPQKPCLSAEAKARIQRALDSHRT
jgi:hypothetical protein